MSKPDPIYLLWQRRAVRIRRDDPWLSRYGSVIRRLEAAMTITTSVETLMLVMADEHGMTCVVLDDGSEIRLRRRTTLPSSRPSVPRAPRLGDDWLRRRVR